MSKKQIKKKKTNKTKKTTTSASSNYMLWLGTALALTLLAMIPVFSTGLLNYDDELYITENPLIQNFRIGDLFSQFYKNQYSPVAMGIMALWYKIGLGVGALKTISVLWHLLNVGLVFSIIQRLFGKVHWAFFIAALFGVSTLQLESVAWLAASMKIGTYGFFFLCSILWYLRYLERHNKFNLVVSIIFFVLSCFSKEQAVALAPTLVLIDYFKKRNWLSVSVLLEKIPYFIIAIIFGIITLKASATSEVKNLVYEFGLGERILFAAYAVGSYFAKLTIPFDLSFFYTYPVKGQIPISYYLFTLLFVGILVYLVQAIRNKNRVIIFALMFFLLNIGLSIFTQLLSVRDVLMADRYVYISAIGWFVLLAYILENVLSPKLGKNVAHYIGLGLIVLLAGITFSRGSVWNDSISIFTDVIEKEELSGGQKNPYLALPYNNRGIAYKRKKNIKAAMADFERAIAASNKYASGFLNRGNIYFDRGDDKLAMSDYNHTLELEPNNTKALSARGAIFAKQGNSERAFTDLNRAIELEPYFADALSNRGLLNMQLGKYTESIADFSAIIGFRPNAHDIYSTRGVVYGRAGKMDESIRDYNKAIQLAPQNGNYYLNRAYAYAQMGNNTAALQDAQKAKQLGANVSNDLIESLQ